MKKLDIGGKLKNSVNGVKTKSANSNIGSSGNSSGNENNNGAGLLKKIKSGLGEWVDEGAGAGAGGNGGGELAKVKDDLVVKVHVPGAPEGTMVVVGVDQVHRVWEDPQGPRLILIIDETNELMMPTKIRTESGKEEDSQKAEIGMLLTSLTQLSRSTKINCLLASQRAEVGAINGTIQNNSLSLNTALKVKRKLN